MPPSPAPPDVELCLHRDFAARPERVYAAWTRRLPEWWGPRGTTVPSFTMDLRPGGRFCAVLRTADGTEFTTCGVFLDVVPGERLVFTDAFDPGWVPRPGFFFTGFVRFEGLPGGGTRCTVRAVHWTAGQRAQHERMGFHPGWGESLDRLADLVTND
jgi:uncharacterized protein YndB with AHSA1/START domain